MWRKCRQYNVQCIHTCDFCKSCHAGRILHMRPCFRKWYFSDALPSRSQSAQIPGIYLNGSISFYKRCTVWDLWARLWAESHVRQDMTFCKTCFLVFELISVGFAQGSIKNLAILSPLQERRIMCWYETWVKFLKLIPCLLPSRIA